MKIGRSVFHYASIKRLLLLYGEMKKKKNGKEKSKRTNAKRRWAEETESNCSECARFDVSMQFSHIQFVEHIKLNEDDDRFVVCRTNI